MNSPQLRSSLVLGAVALAALAVSLLLAFASVVPQRPSASVHLHGAVAAAPILAPTSETAPPSSRPLRSLAGKPAVLWTLLEPWVLAVDALAVLGAAAVLGLGRDTRRRKART